MNDLIHASTFFLIFEVTLVGYGTLLAYTGNKNLLPQRAMHSVSGPDDVRRVGRIVVRVGIAVAVAALILRLLSGLSS